MDITAYTTYADIRAVIGLTEEELPDNDLALETYKLGLESALYAIGETLEDSYLTASAAIIAGTETTIQKVLYRSARLYATAQVSFSVAQSLPMRSQKAITDGKAGLSRFTDSPYRDTLENLQGLLSSAEANLKDAFAALSGATSVDVIPSFMGVVSPTYDPVTG